MGHLRVHAASQLGTLEPWGSNPEDWCSSTNIVVGWSVQALVRVLRERGLMEPMPVRTPSEHLPARPARWFHTGVHMDSSQRGWRSSTNIAAGSQALAPIPVEPRHLEADKDQDRDIRAPDKNTTRLLRSTTIRSALHAARDTTDRPAIVQSHIRGIGEYRRASLHVARVRIRGDGRVRPQRKDELRLLKALTQLER